MFNNSNIQNSIICSHKKNGIWNGVKLILGIWKFSQRLFFNVDANWMCIFNHSFPWSQVQMEQFFPTNLIWIPFIYPKTFTINETWYLQKHENLKVAYN